MSLHVGASVDVVAGNYEGQRGTVTKLTAQQVYVDLSSGESVRIAQTSVCVRSGAVTPPGAGTPPGARVGPAVPPSPPVTQQQSRRTHRPVLTVSEDSSLKELRDFIDRHDLPISKGVGGRSRRTKDEMFAEIQTAWEHEAMDTAADFSTAERPLPPRQTRSMTGDAPGMRLFLGGYQKVSLQDHFRFVLHDRIGGIESLMRDAVGAEGNRLCAAPGDYVIDEPSSKGLAHLLGLTTVQLCTAMARGVDAITDEIRTHGTADDVECLRYVLEARAGSSDKRFANGVRDEGRQGERLDDFVQMQEAVSAGLEREEVLALRLYTTVAYLSLNAALRDPLRCGPYPFPATIGFITSGIKKLRENDVYRESPMDLFRGMRNLQLLDDTRFMSLPIGADEEDGRLGGIERALMSTTTSLEVALRYAASETALLFKIRTDNFRQRGGSIKFLSCFPNESEILFPPLTYLQPTGQREEVRLDGATFTIVEVKPDVD